MIESTMYIGHCFVTTKNVNLLICKVALCIITLFYVLKICMHVFLYSKSLITSTNSKNAGSMLAYHPIWDEDNYVKHDKVFKESCCNYSTDMCEEYYSMTSSGDTAEYTVPSSGIIIIK